MKRALLFVAAGSALLTGGCVSNTLPSPVISVPARFEVAETASAPQAIDSWWRLFDDPQLTELVEHALVAAPDARTALARLREAQAVRRGALTSFDPQGDITAGASKTHTHLSGIPSQFQSLITTQPSAPILNAGTTISWEVDLFGRRRATRKAADADLAAEQFDFEATRLSLAADVASSLMQSRGLAAQVAEAKDTLRIAADLARVGQIRVQAGLGSESDAARLDTDLATAQSDLAGLDAQFTVARRTLLVLIGRGTDPIETLPVDATLPALPLPPSLTPGEAMARRPDVREAEQRLQSAAGTLKLDQLALFPRLTLQPGASYTRITGAGGYATSLWSIAAGLAIPVLDRKRLLAEIGAQTARGEQAVIAYEHAVQAAYGEAENSLTTLSADRVRIDRLTFAEQRAHYAFAAQQQGYHAGIVDLDTLLQTERTWRDTRIALVTLRTSALIDAITSFKAMGGGWDPIGTPPGDHR